MEGPQERLRRHRRVSPTFLVQDGMVPRSLIPSTLRHIAEVSEKYGVTISNIFTRRRQHHPIILFDMRKQETWRKRRRPLRHSASLHQAGGCITGEHGVGMEKLDLMKEQYSEASLELQTGLKRLFDTAGLFNPGKRCPTR